MGQEFESASQCAYRELASWRYRPTPWWISAHDFYLRRRLRDQFARVTRQLRCATARIWAKTRFRWFERTIHWLPMVRSRLIRAGRSRHVRNLWCGHSAGSGSALRKPKYPEGISAQRIQKVGVPG